MTHTAPAPLSPGVSADIAPAASPAGLDAASAWMFRQSPFTRWLEKYRLLFFVALSLLIVAGFSGQWRIGLDSSIYRGIAENLANGRGYTFAGRSHTQVYPGLPFVMAALQRLTGTNSVVPILIVMNVLAIGTMALVYQLIKLRYPVWVAVIVTCGVAMNTRFTQQAQEVMTDTPFLFGCVLSMLGWELLLATKCHRRTGWATALLTAGLFIAAVMRPTFWVLAGAWALAAAWAAVRQRNRRAILALSVLGAVFVAFAALDPRVRGLNILQGEYEKQLIALIPDLPSRIRANAPSLFMREIPEAFFGDPMAWAHGAFALILLAGAALVTRRQPLWGLQIFLLTIAMLMLSDVPRYYLMVLPELWVGYVLVFVNLTRSIKSNVPRDWLLFVMVSFSNFMNFGVTLGLLHEQHAKDFIKSYRHGAYVALIDLSRVIRDTVPPDQNVIGPYGQLLTYLSGRNVLGALLMGFNSQGVTKHPAIVASQNPQWLVGPLSTYEAKDRPLMKLLEHGVIVPGKLVTQNKEFWLSHVTVIVPTTDWRQLPATRPHPTADRPPRHSFTAEELDRRKLKAYRAWKAKRLAIRDRLRKRQRAQAATQHAVPPTTVRPAPPMTQPAP